MAAEALTPNELRRALMRLACGAANINDAEMVNSHIEALEELLDEADQADYFGTEGWRHRIGIDN